MTRGADHRFLWSALVGAPSGQGRKIGGAGYPAQRHLVFKNDGALQKSSGADPLVRAGPPDPLFVWNQLPAERERPARGPAADQGVRPTIYAGVRRWEN